MHAAADHSSSVFCATGWGTCVPPMVLGGGLWLFLLSCMRLRCEPRRSTLLLLRPWILDLMLGGVFLHALAAGQF